MKPILLTVALLLSAFKLGCAAEAPFGEVADLALGERLDADKADGEWGAALTCKTVPELPRLASPEITISLHGLTVRLRDRTTGFDKVFPVGVGAINTEAGSSTLGESLSYYPVRATRKNVFAITRAAVTPCKTWWTDPETGKRQPVFAGLPFMAFYGGYALHGPIDNFRAANGGNLRRGFVSHGCIRMESADILEVFARTRGAASIPVRVLREAEREAGGRRVDVPPGARWVGAECAADGDCGFAGGFCKRNRYSDRGFCTMRCTRSCPDKAGAPMTFCVADADDASKGVCTLKVGGQLADCRALDHFVSRTAPRLGQPTTRATVCLPGSPGWIGDRCLATSECRPSLRCTGSTQKAGICTQSCTRACPDAPGYPMTFCASDPAGAACARTCTPASNAGECPASHDCLERSRAGGTGRAFACVPR